MIKYLKNDETAIILEDVATINNFLIEKGSQIKVVNMMKVSAIIDVLPKVTIKYFDEPLYRRCIIRSEYMFTPIERKE